MDTIDPTRRTENMSRIRSRDTIPELKVRKTLTKLGYRYRLHVAKLPGKPDIVMARRKKAIFVHGCFWHQHERCRYGRLPKSRLEYWGTKLARNRTRDEEIASALRRLGWSVLVIWECEIDEPDKLEVLLKAFLTE
jgi:DNA mismatch endonuclease (patch repair protein)